MKPAPLSILTLTLLLSATAGIGFAAEPTASSTNSSPAATRRTRFDPDSLSSAYSQHPNNMEVVHAYIRYQLLARTNLSEPLVARKLPATIPQEFKFITDAPRFPDSSKSLSRSKLLADLDYLEIAIANAYSYADRRGADWRGGLDALRASLAEQTPINTFILRLRRYFTLFGDPHSGLHAVPSAGFIPRGTAPFLAAPDGQRVLAIKPDRTAFLDNDCRYLDAIDGVDLGEWIRVAGFDVPKASPQWAWRQTVPALSRIDYLRSELGLKSNDVVQLTLVSADRKKKTTLSLPVTEKPAKIVSLTFGKSRVLEGGIGYLRLAKMDADPAFLAKLDKSMDEFRETRGLIIDVRDNGGGTQDAVKTILPYFLVAEDPMKIINVAAYRLPVKLPQPCADGYLGLGGRGLHPVTSRAWSDAQRPQIETFLKTFSPSWNLPRDKFSAWHVMGLSASTNPKAYRYGKPVVVLTDAGCFSATDNFLGALKGHPNVTLLGTTSGGGSGRMAEYALPNSRLPLTLCQMASFRANGDIFDGKGVSPDVVLESIPEDQLVTGGDSVLKAAVARWNP